VNAEPEDHELARVARGGSSEAFERLVARHELALFRFLRMRTGRADLAEELAQDAFVRCWTKLHLFDCRHAFRPWLFRIAANLAASRCAQRSSDSAAPNGAPAAAGEPVADTRDPLSVVTAREEGRNLWDLVRRTLSAEACSALWLFHAEGLPSASIAEVLGKSEGSIRTLLSRSRARLAGLLRGTGRFLEVR